MFLDQFLFELSCKKTHMETKKHGNNTDAHKEYSTVAFCKNAAIKLVDSGENTWHKIW